MSAEPELTQSLAAVRSLFGAAACSCALADEDGGGLTFVAADGIGAEAIVGVHLPISRGIAGWAVMSGQPIAVRDVAVDARFARDVAEATDYVPTSILAAPMFDDDGEALGVVEVLDPAVDGAADWTLAVLGTLAAQIARIHTLSSRQQDGRPGAGPAASELERLGLQVLALVEDHRR